MKQDYTNRVFQSPEDNITGKSIVIENKIKNTEAADLVLPDYWPYSLSDYLQNFIGNQVLVQCIQANGRYGERKGRLKAVGSNFIVIQPVPESLLIIEFSFIRSINILNHKENIISTTRRRR